MEMEKKNPEKKWRQMPEYPSDMTEQEITREMNSLIEMRKKIKERQKENFSREPKKKQEEKKIERKDPADWTENDIESELTYEKKRIGKENVRHLDEREKWKVIDGQRVIIFNPAGRRVCIDYILRSVERHHDDSENSKKYFCGDVEYGSSIFRKESSKDVYRKQEQYRTAKARVTRFSIFCHCVWTDLDDLEKILRETMKKNGCQRRRSQEQQQQEDEEIVSH